MELVLFHELNPDDLSDYENGIYKRKEIEEVSIFLFHIRSFSSR